MGAKQSKGGKVTDQNGTDANTDEGLDTFNKTSTLPATFRSKDDDIAKGGTLPRGDGANIDRNTSFSKRFRKSVSRLIGVSEKEEKNGSSPQKESSPAEVNTNGEASPAKDESDQAVKSPVDHKLAQKIARAKFFQDLYTTPTNVPKPPRSLNVSVDTADGEDKSATPVVKLIEKHQEAIEKHQEEIRNSMSSPDIMKERLESFRKSKVIENESLKKESLSESKTETSITNKIENQEQLITTQQSSTQHKTFEATSVACQESASMKVESSQISETKSHHVEKSLETNELISSTTIEQQVSHIEASESVTQSETISQSSVTQSAMESVSQSIVESAQSAVESVTESCEMKSSSVTQSNVESVSQSVNQSAVESVIQSSVASSSISQSVTQTSEMESISVNQTSMSECIEESVVEQRLTTQSESSALESVNKMDESSSVETVTQSYQESESDSQQMSYEQSETCESLVKEPPTFDKDEEHKEEECKVAKDKSADESDAKDSAHESDPESEPE